MSDTKKKKRRGNPGRREMNFAERLAFERVVDAFGGDRKAAIDAINAGINPVVFTGPDPKIEENDFARRVMAIVSRSPFGEAE